MTIVDHKHDPLTVAQEKEAQAARSRLNKELHAHAQRLLGRADKYAHALEDSVQAVENARAGLRSAIMHAQHDANELAKVVEGLYAVDSHPNITGGVLSTAPKAAAALQASIEDAQLQLALIATALERVGYRRVPADALVRARQGQRF